MQFGKVLEKTRKDAGLTQAEMGEKLFCEQSKISKLESGTQELYINTAIEWMNIVERPDIILAYLCGIEVEQLMKYLFDKEYLERVKGSELFIKMNGSLSMNDIANFVFNETEEAIQWKYYLIELTTA